MWWYVQAVRVLTRIGIVNEPYSLKGSGSVRFLQIFIMLEHLNKFVYALKLTFLGRLLNHFTYMYGQYGYEQRSVL